MRGESMHRGVGVLFVDRERGLYLLQQKDALYRPHPYGLSLFGGAVEDGESPEQAALREIAEELSPEAAAELPALTVVYSGLFEVRWEQTVYECRLAPAAFDRLAAIPVREGRASVVVDAATLPGLRMIWGLERTLVGYLRAA